ncbi:cytochrome ubiquinol oxidase subunit I [Candidatus Xianfuyuplasma coldseepsis]|uniref:Cytochrome ubiquinol oxidase subunit I n=1 Tax=Candidatus Xianfuyuplasma coldseepsis TaxID=2782163 RepID=A0A7L7KQR5_9MOLU|nr:cytochrome ubiquinol oxidase subunit I [Xianfuyuplasma coldseepsis]QMS84294.1 cytochrome ubiquinol oxidase subunit I [Xianfuyuplasma coldseepsis]
MVEILSRLQFALTIAFHFIFVPLTVGLIILVLVFEIKYYRSDDQRFKILSNYFSDIFLINYAFGIVTGIAMTVQFGTNWGNFTVVMGEIFGSPLVLEAILAFFLESTFNGIWFFRKNQLTKKLRLIVVSMITIGTTLSAVWIITVNGFMHNPVGATWDGTQMVLNSFAELVFNPYAWYMFFHNHISAILLSGFVVLAISSWHLLKGKEEDKEIFKIAARYGSWTILITAILLPLIGNSYMGLITEVQPTKINMIQGLQTGTLEAVVRISFHIMVGLGFLFLGFGMYTVIFRKKYEASPTLQSLYVKLVPLPYIAIITGWIVTELGRQPWIIYNIMETSAGVSDVPVAQVWFSIITITLFYAILFILDYVLTISRIKKGILPRDGGVNHE